MDGSGDLHLCKPGRCHCWGNSCMLAVFVYLVWDISLGAEGAPWATGCFCVGFFGKDMNWGCILYVLGGFWLEFSGNLGPVVYDVEYRGFNNVLDTAVSSLLCSLACDVGDCVSCVCAIVGGTAS